MGTIGVERYKRYGEIEAFPERSSIMVTRFAEHVNLVVHEWGTVHPIQSVVLTADQADQLAGLVREAVADADAYKLVNQ